MIKTNIKGVDLVFETSKSLFSPRAIDLGTLSMLSVVEFGENEKVLDLGCGYGVVGILAAKIVGEENVVMLDIDEEAVKLAQKNALLNGVPGVKTIQSDGFTNLDEKDFTLILCNPPYHTDFSVAKVFIEKGFNRLCIGGRMYMVTKRKKWYKNKLIAIFGGVQILEINGYYVFMAIKKSSTYAKVSKEKGKKDRKGGSK
ncbi:MAG: class I SAM-dependent methyltransferase [Firmicutes bacterium]|nr:class I SAM-dependent methyltransferase [Bacillota bacterium]